MATWCLWRSRLLSAEAYLDAFDAMSDVEQHRVGRVLRGRPPTFRAWNQRHWPTWNWNWRYIVRLQDTLELVQAGVLKRVIIVMPPRHGKSETATIRFPVDCLAEDPSMRIIIGAYNTTLATKFSRKARRIAEAEGIALSVERSAADDWETEDGGGVRAIGVGSGVTGHGGDGIIVDDPVKSREEAESDVYREKVWEWWTDDLYTRLEPNAWMLVIATRWHHDDLIGRILASETANQWTVVRFPAIAEEKDSLGREEGDALNPERYDREYLLNTKLVMGEYSFEALYQGNPTPRSGNMFPRDKANFIRVLPALAIRWIRYWDKAATKDGGKRTAGVKMGYVEDTKRFIVAHVTKGQWGADERDAIMKGIAAGERNIRVRVEQEPGSGGKESAQITTKILAGSSILDPDRVTGKKEDRAEPFSSQWKGGNVDLLEPNAGEENWIKEYLDELEQFPNGKFSDQTDASSGAFNTLMLAPTPRARSLSQ